SLAAAELLLVLDNCEHVLDACVRLVDALLSSCPHLRILATSRQALGLHGEIVRAVSPLSLPGQGWGIERSVLSVTGGAPNGTTLNARHSTLLQQSEAVRLFVERAAAARTEFALGESNSAAAVQVCRRLDGIP